MTLWTIACLASLSMGFSRQEYQGGLQFLPPGDPPNPDTEPTSHALAGRFFTHQAERVASVNIDIYSTMTNDR